MGQSLINCVLMLAILATVPAAAIAEEQTSALEEEAGALAAEFIGRLKPELQRAMGEGGPQYAIGVCADKAPMIADALSQDSGWLVRRVSLKARNASRAIPDRWETSVLEEFERRQQAGEPASNLRYSETTPSHFRYLQAQAVDGVCLTCHGSNPSPQVQETLRQYYPDDKATGYEPGQVRGAISLSKRL